MGCMQTIVTAVNYPEMYAALYLEINLMAVLLVLFIRFKTLGISEMVSQRNFSNAIDAQVVFFLSAFDRPFDKTADGLDLPTSLTAATEEKVENEAPAQVKAVSGVKTIVLDTAPKATVAESSADRGSAAGTPAVANHGEWVSQQQDIAPEMAEATSNYVEELNKLTIMLGKVSEQSARLTRDSEEMENLNRTLTGICKVYELQLKSASSQIGTIDQINEQTQKMAKQIAELNKIYTRMIEAMTVNMRQAAPGVMPMASDED